jgi:putative DNA primase/helicase
MSIEHREDIDIYRCIDCKTDHFTEEKAEACCDEARDRLIARLREAELDTCRFIPVKDGEKASIDHNQRALSEISGNYGVYAGGGLVDVDIDDYDGDHDTDVLDRLPATFTVETPHGGEHRYYHVTGPVGKAVSGVTGGKANATPSWGEVRLHNQYTVGPGSQLAGCSKEWCSDCAKPDGGYYTILHDRPVSTIAADELADVLRADENYCDEGSSADSGGGSVDTSGSSAVDFDVEERLSHTLEQNGMPC